MKYTNSISTSLFTLLVLSVLYFSGCGQGTSDPEKVNPYMKFLTLEIDATKSMTVAIILPECFEPAKAYPALLAIPPGAQTIESVDWAIEKYYISQSIQRNWLVISPVAPDGILFYKGSEVYIPILLDEVANAYEVEGGKFHLAGISSGGVSAFRMAVTYPERFASITVFPGVPTSQDFPILNQLIPIPVSMYVGANDDPELISAMDSTATRLGELGVDVDYQVLPNEGHVIDGLTATVLFDLFDSRR